MMPEGDALMHVRRMVTAALGATGLVLLGWKPVAAEVSGLTVRLPGGVSLFFMDLAAGTFQMGSPSGEADRSPDETLHQVTLTHDFLIQATEVTQGQWRTLMGNNPSEFTGDDNRPVEQVSWYDAVAYANALSAREGLPKAYDLSSCSGTPGTDNYSCGNVTFTAATPYATTGWRLPTEAEWEYAYRAGTSTPWFFGSDSNLLGTYAWFSSNSGNKTQPVGQKQPNAWGLYDMAGNV
ncbi:MAG: formylglycine-generating enzyme family protein, partial [Candidatus Sericytochromatia bacterium]|nr:formylglycine-generating enzyme family protein [Candidatus Sericytochromatia bacterium]